MNYTPGDIFKAMGRKWWCDDDFWYPLDPNLRYSTMSLTTMQAEWEWRTSTLSCCVEQCQLNGVRIPKQRATLMQRDTPQQLELALFRAREEENRMRLRLLRKSLLEDSIAYAREGDQERASQYHHFAMSPDYNSDCFMSDEE